MRSPLLSCSFTTRSKSIAHLIGPAKVQAGLEICKQDDLNQFLGKCSGKF